MLLEDNMNLQYFVHNYQSSQLNDFRVHSLKPEAFFEKAINDDIKKMEEKHHHGRQNY